MLPVMNETWRNLLAWYDERLPEVVASLRPGVDATALADFERALVQEIDRGLPDDLKALYLEHDGQDSATYSGLFFGLAFLPLAEARTVWEGLRDLAQGAPGLRFEPEGEVYPPNAIRPEYVNNGRVPFAHDWSGSYLAVDLLPGPEGQVGQVINFADGFDKYVVAPSLSAFLDWMLDQYRVGNYRISVTEVGSQQVRNIEVRNPPYADFLDAVTQLFGPKA